jgi:predicted HTH domain antitoxin
VEITINLKDEYFKWLQEMANETQTDKEEMLRSFAVKCIYEYKLRKAIRQYSEGSISLGKASEISGIPKRLLLYKFREIGIPLNLTEKNFVAGMDTLTSIRTQPNSTNSY